VRDYIALSPKNNLKMQNTHPAVGLMANIHDSVAAWIRFEILQSVGYYRWINEKTNLKRKIVIMSQQSIIKRILEWNESAGNKPPVLGTMDVEALTLQLGFVGEEYIEVVDELAVLEIDTVKMAKEIGDLVFTAVEAIRRLGFDPEEVMNLVCDSNDSKFAANTAEIAQATEYFNEKRVAFLAETLPNGLVVFRSSKDQEMDGKLLLKGKILKAPCHYKAEPAIREYANRLKAAH